MGKVTVYAQEVDRLKRSLAFGVLNFMYAVEADAKREAPVRGGYRSFMSTKRGKAGQVLIGGTLRRSIHATTYYKGQTLVAADDRDDNGEAIPDYDASPDIVGYAGTNCSYGAFVEFGTVKMEARPFLSPAFDGNVPNASALINAGARRKR
jgi:HK97 gp10 family phage protein